MGATDNLLLYSVVYTYFLMYFSTFDSLVCLNLDQFAQQGNIGRGAALFVDGDRVDVAVAEGDLVGAVGGEVLHDLAERRVAGFDREEQADVLRAQIFGAQAMEGAGVVDDVHH